MEAPKSLRPPANWTDFESLCKKLWGEIWQCPEIRRNGRSGQKQHGVDIYGIPKGESAYWGIQCKAKEAIVDSKFTDAEIKLGVEQARMFQPKLAKLYFATTAPKDVKIEEFVRKVNIESRTDGLFQVHIFCWEDIVDLLDENRATHDWYVKSLKYKNSHNILVSFADEQVEITANPKFKLRIRRFVSHADNEKFQSSMSHITSLYKTVFDMKNAIVGARPKVNRSYIPVKLWLKNTGISSLEHIKILWEIPDEIQDIALTNEEHGIASIYMFHRPDVFLNDDKRSGRIIPLKPILVGSDLISFDTFYVKPKPEKYSLNIKWKFISKDYQDTGNLTIRVEPMVDKHSDFVVGDPDEGPRESWNDFLETKSDVT